MFIMTVFAKLKCALRTGQKLEPHYRSLSSAQLRARQRSLSTTFWVTGISWGTALTLMLVFQPTKPPLLVLYSGAVLASVWASYRDYRQRKQLIERVLAERTA